MPALVIESFPEALHAKLTQIAAAHRRSVTQETIHLLEAAIEVEEKKSSEPLLIAYWQKRPLLPEYEALVRSGALSGGTDSTQMISDDRDGR
jgi:plasmid stability protein